MGSVAAGMVLPPTDSDSIRIECARVLAVTPWTENGELIIHRQFETLRNALGNDTAASPRVDDQVKGTLTIDFDGRQ